MTTSLFSMTVNLLGLAAVSGATLMAALILRNPRFSRWLDNEGVALGTGLILTAGVTFAVANAAAELAGAGIGYGIVPIVVAGVLAGSAYVFWKVFAIGDRLARADAGQSPFARPQEATGAPTAGLHPVTTGR